MPSKMACCALLLVTLTCSACAHFADESRRMPQRRLLQEPQSSPAGATANFVSRSPMLSQAPNLFAASTREFVYSPSGYQNALGLVVAYFDGGQTRSHCSGAAITPSAVLTAAHCFFDKKTNRSLSPSIIKFYPAVTYDAQGNLKSRYGDPNEPGNGVSITSIHIHPDYQAAINKDASKFTLDMGKVDMAVLNLEKDAVDAADTFAVITSCQYRAPNGDKVVQNVDAATAGYPKDYNSGEKFGTLVQSLCDITVATDTSCTDKELDHQCSILGGNSGGPIFVINRTNNGAKRFSFTDQPALVFAVQSGEVVNEGVCSSSTGIEIFADVTECYNFAAEINDAAKNLILGWATGLVVP